MTASSAGAAPPADPAAGAGRTAGEPPPFPWTRTVTLSAGEVVWGLTPNPGSRLLLRTPGRLQSVRGGERDLVTVTGVGPDWVELTALAPGDVWWEFDWDGGEPGGPRDGTRVRVSVPPPGRPVPAAGGGGGEASRPTLAELIARVNAGRVFPVTRPLTVDEVREAAGRFRLLRKITGGRPATAADLGGLPASVSHVPGWDDGAGANRVTAATFLRPDGTPLATVPLGGGGPVAFAGGDPPGEAGAPLRDRVRAALEEATADESLPLETRLRLALKLDPNRVLTADEIAALWRRRAELRKEVDRGRSAGGPSVARLAEQRRTLALLAEVGATPPDAAVIEELALSAGGTRAADRLRPDDPRQVLIDRAVADAAGLRAALQAVGELDREAARGFGGMRAESARDLLLERLAASGPVNDEARTEVLLEAIAWESHAVRAAALEALAAIP